MSILDGRWFVWLGGRIDAVLENNLGQIFRQAANSEGRI